MATLCTLLISCNKEDLINDSLETELTSRSVTNPIKVVSTTLSGNSTIHFCTKAAISYANAHALVDLTFDNNTTVSYLATNASLIVASGYTLDVTIDGNTTVETEDLSVDICGGNLCYGNTSGTIVGTAHDFIIDDVDGGF